MRFIPRATATASLALLAVSALSAQLHPPKTWRWRTETPAQKTNEPEKM